MTDLERVRDRLLARDAAIIDAHLKEAARLREALEEIANLEPMFSRATDEYWARGYGASEDVYHECQNIARNALKDTT